ncbi:MAG: gliding motility-associated C-terminal domain-containing protein [Saprospiraceae bacterium]|nr:gliding motility-associated C-terminal domain-containing protein [Saprospiraceae bacterium]
MHAQSIITLEDCGTSYIDPQAENDDGVQTRDTLIYQTFFEADKQLRAFYIDINAFGGQQIDRAEAYAIMPDSTQKALGNIAFGNCADCVDGFALVLDDSLMVSNVLEKSTLDLWLQSFSQPPFTLTGNLQTLSGVGRLSGRIPICAIGLRIAFSVYSNPANTSTSFSAHIVCPEAITPCGVNLAYEIDCQNNELRLLAELPANCYRSDARIQWSHANGFAAENLQATLPLSGNLGWYYFEVEEDCCIITDSIFIENPPFAQAGLDQTICQGEPVTFAGTGGMGHFWESPAGIVQDSIISIPSPTEADDGVWILHAFNDENCEDTDSLLLSVQTPPLPELNIPSTCLGETVDFSLLNDTAYVNIEWFDPTGAMMPEGRIPDLQVAYFGTYSVEATDEFGCTSTRSFELSGSDPPAIEVLFEDKCDSTLVYILPDNLQYRWETGDTTSSISSTDGGQYQLTITDATGCSTSSLIDVPRPDGPNFDIQVEDPFCPNEPGSINIIPEDLNRPMIFSIDGGNTYVLNGEFKDLLPGTYQLTIQDDLGCIQEREVNIVAPDTLGVSLDLEELNIRPLTPVDLQAQVVGSPVAIQWVPEEINTGEINTSFIADKDLDVRIIVEDARGCRASDGFPLTIVLGDIYVPNVFSPNDDGLNDYFTFFSDNTSGEQIASLLIFDRQGNLVFEREDFELNAPQLGWDGYSRGRLLNTGIYTYYGLVRFGNGAIKTYEGDLLLMQ